MAAPVPGAGAFAALRGANQSLVVLASFFSPAPSPRASGSSYCRSVSGRRRAFWSVGAFKAVTPSGAAPCSLLISVLAIAAATDRAGPFENHSRFEIMADLMALNGSAVLTALLLSAMVTEQKNVRPKIEQACVELAELVARLSPP
jgi:hypothetical protein